MGNLNKKQAMELLCQVLGRCPGIIFDLIDKARRPLDLCTGVSDEDRLLAGEEVEVSEEEEKELLN